MSYNRILFGHFVLYSYSEISLKCNYNRTRKNNGPSIVFDPENSLVAVLGSLQVTNTNTCVRVANYYFSLVHHTHTHTISRYTYPAECDDAETVVYCGTGRPTAPASAGVPAFGAEVSPRIQM